MSRLDRFEDILKSYDGKTQKQDYFEGLRAGIPDYVCDMFDSLRPELQLKIAKYFTYATKTGRLVEIGEDGELIEADTAAFPNFLELIIDDFTYEKDESKLKTLLTELDKILEAYEKR